MSKTPQRIAMIGAGRVARQLTLWLKSKGVEVAQIYNRSPERAKSLAADAGAQVIENLDALDKDLDLCIIAVSDDAIASVADALPVTDAVVVHTSGARPISDLKRHPKHGVFYPLQTFTADRPADFHQVPLCLEGSDEAVTSMLKTAGVVWGVPVYQLNTAQREVLHVAAVLANNFTNHLWGKSFELLRQNDMEPGMLYPLLMETMRKAVNSDPNSIQTGPAVRGDEETIARHLDKLKDDANLREIYTTLTRSIQDTHGKL